MPNWNELRRTIPNGEVLVPGQDGYAASLGRWSTAAEMKSVCLPRSLLGLSTGEPANSLTGCGCEANLCP